MGTKDPTSKVLIFRHVICHNILGSTITFSQYSTASHSHILAYEPIFFFNYYALKAKSTNKVYNKEREDWKLVRVGTKEIKREGVENRTLMKTLFNRTVLGAQQWFPQEIIKVRQISLGELGASNGHYKFIIHLPLSQP